MLKPIEVQVVDDDLDFLEAFRVTWPDDSYFKFKMFSDANLFLNTFDRSLDLAILDVNQPNFDIVNAVKQIDEYAPMAYIIVLSKYSDIDVIEDLIELGIFRYIGKGNPRFKEKITSALFNAYRKIKARNTALPDGR